MQVVTNENIQQLITTGKVEDFKPPEPKVDVKPDAPVATEIKADEAKAETPPRGEDGKFKKAESKEEAKEPAKKVDDDDDPVLTEKIRRIVNKKHREMREAQEFATGEGRRAIAAERRAEALQAEIDALKGKKSDGAESETLRKGEPDPKDFKTVGEYTRALVKFEASEAGKKSLEHAAESKQKEAADATIAQFAKRQEAFIATTADYADVLQDAPDVPPVAGQYIIESEVGPQLAYYLAKNPDVIASLHKLSPSRVIAQLGKLETQFEKTADAPNKAAAPSNEISKAPAPIQTLEAKSTPVVKDPKDMNFQELRAYRDAERRAKRA